MAPKKGRLGFHSHVTQRVNKCLTHILIFGSCGGCTMYVYLYMSKYIKTSHNSKVSLKVVYCNSG